MASTLAKKCCPKKTWKETQHRFQSQRNAKAPLEISLNNFRSVLYTRSLVFCSMTSCNPFSMPVYNPDLRPKLFESSSLSYLGLLFLRRRRLLRRRRRIFRRRGGGRRGLPAVGLGLRVRHRHLAAYDGLTRHPKIVTDTDCRRKLAFAFEKSIARRSLR